MNIIETARDELRRHLRDGSTVKCLSNSGSEYKIYPRTLIVDAFQNINESWLVRALSSDNTDDHNEALRLMRAGLRSEIEAAVNSELTDWLNAEKERTP